MTKVKVQRLNLWRMKDGVSPDEVVRDDVANLQSEDFQVGDMTGKTYFKQTPQRSVPWHEFVRSATSGKLNALESQSAAALMVVTVDGRTYALSFGHSRTWMSKSVIERRFGMMVTLNAVDIKSLKSVDHEELEALQRKTRTQTSSDAEFDQFGVDVQRDLLRSVTGRPEEDGLAEHLVGADNLIASVRLEPSALEAKIREFGALADKDLYKTKGFDWIDHFAKVSDPVLLAELDGLLVADLKAEALDHVFLAAPSALDYQSHLGFLYSGERAKTAEKRPELRISDWIAHIGADNISLKRLKSDNIRRYGSSDLIPDDVFPVYEALIYEQKKDSFLYVLSNEEWYKIDDDHVKAVESELSSIPLCSLLLPDAFAGETEGDYNERAALASSGYLDLLDRKVVSYGGGRSRIEICDLFSTDGKFIHVKSKIKSATLSHLFSQGTVSAQAFRDHRYRTAAKAKCSTTHAVLFDGNPDPKDHEVVFAIMTTTTGDIRTALPFLSKQSLVNSAGIIMGLGHPICVMAISVV